MTEEETIYDYLDSKPIEVLNKTEICEVKLLSMYRGSPYLKLQTSICLGTFVSRLASTLNENLKPPDFFQEWHRIFFQRLIEYVTAKGATGMI